MFSFLKQKDFIHPYIIWLMVLIWFIVVGDNLFPGLGTNLNNFITEQSFWLLSQSPKQTQHITIVAIDETSRNHLSLKWPWRRSVTAELIRNIAALSPRVIGLDIVFSGYSEIDEDNELESALKAHPKIVLGYLLKENFEEKPVSGFIEAASSIGFVNKPLHGRLINKTRNFYMDHQNNLHWSLDLAILMNYYGIDENEIVINESGIRLKDHLFIPSQAGMTPLNYLVYPTQFRIIPAASVFKKEVNPSHIRDKIVLVGATDPIIHDEYATPLGVFPGVSIIGNSLVMFLSKRYIYHVSTIKTVFLMFILGSFIIIANKELAFLHASLISILLLSFIYFSFLFLRSKDIVLPYLPILFAVASAYVNYNIYKYSKLLMVSNRLKKQAILEPSTGLYTNRYFLLILDEKLKSNTDVSFAGLRLLNYKQISVNLSFEQIQVFKTHIGDLIKCEINKNLRKSYISYLSVDTLGIFVLGEKRGKIETFLKEIFIRIQNNAWESEDIIVRTSIQACLIHKFKNDACDKYDLINQMGRMFKDIKENQIMIERFNKRSADKEMESRKIDYKDDLDLITYEWEERNKDLEKSLKELSNTNKKLDQLNWGTLRALARAIDAKSSWTAGHSERVTTFALRIGRVLQLSQDELDNLQRAGLLHDIGKIGIPLDILDKPARLSDEEFDIIREHPQIGARILEPIEAYRTIIPIAMQHHERFDGKGYPEGLSGEALDLGARILGVADVFDALTSDRPYRAGMSEERAIEIIKEGTGTQFDPKIVEAFLEALSNESERNDAK